MKDPDMRELGIRERHDWVSGGLLLSRREYERRSEVSFSFIEYKSSLACRMVALSGDYRIATAFRMTARGPRVVFYRVRLLGEDRICGDIESLKDRDEKIVM
jgi:hypothetical protein